MSDATASPLSGPPPREIPLPRAPLVCVLAQVRFPVLLVIKEGQAPLAAFQERIRDIYPFFSKEDVQNAHVAFGPQGPNVRSEASVIWRFLDETGDWRLSLAPDFVAVETMRYTNRDDFLQRMVIALTAVREVYEPKVATRIGLRYVDQIKDDAFTIASTLIRPAVVGIFGLVEPERVRHGICEIALKADEGDLLLKWGQLPAKKTFDPNIVKPIETDSWILDLDMSSDTRAPFDPAALQVTLKSFAARIYSTFRWLITDEFLKYYGDNET